MNNHIELVIIQNKLDDVCCICLDETALNTSPACCNYNIHKDCVIQWYISSGTFSCPMCRVQFKRNVKIDDIIKYDYRKIPVLSNYKFQENLNKLVELYNIEYNTAICVFNFNKILSIIKNTIIFLIFLCNILAIIFLSYAEFKNK